MWKAGKQMLTKNKEYFEAYDDGLFSTPYTNPFEEFQQKVEEMKGQINNGNFLIDIIKRKIPNAIKHPIKTIYGTSWNAAWAGDKYIRLVTYNYLKDSGFSSKDAAQVAALFHGDYASVPAQTRKTLNKIFFTPTFKIVMTKLYDKMAKDAIISTAKLARLQAPSKKEAVYGRGLLMVAGIVYGKDFLMTKLGFEQDQFCRRYYKTEETDEGEQVEAVMTFSNPANLVQRYWYKVKPLMDPLETKKGARVFEILKREAHPWYQIADDLRNNQDEAFQPIWNPFDSPGRQVLDVMRFLTRRTFRITEIAFKDETVGNDKARQAIKNSSRRLVYQILKPITFQYVRAVKNRRVYGQLKRLENEFAKFLITDQPRGEEEYRTRIKKLIEMQETISKKFIKEDVEEIDIKKDIYVE